MKFGAVPDQLLSTLDLQLPPEPDFNSSTLPGTPALAPKAYVGAGVWGDKDWTGTVFPPKTPAAKFRSLYPNYFNVIELNATHYNIYSPDVLRQWAAPAQGKDFKFCPKFPQLISHQSGFKNVDELTGAFLESVSSLEENLGPVFLQVSENYSPAYKDALFTYLASLPKAFPFFLEVRHPGWFATKKFKEELFGLLRNLQIGAVITDTPGRRDATHLYLTLPTLFLRFVCNALHPTSFSRIDDWIGQIIKWKDRGLQEVYVILHPGNDAAVPTLADYWVQQLNTHCGFHLKSPMVQQNLF